MSALVFRETVSTGLIHAAEPLDEVICGRDLDEFMRTVSGAPLDVTCDRCRELLEVHPAEEAVTGD